MSGDPHAEVERRSAARHLLASPLVCRELEPDVFALIRRHEADLDRWMTTRLGYRLEVTADTARLAKTGYVPADRPLRTATGRPLHQLEVVLLCLVLASVVAGPAVVSLRDLVDQVRSSAVDAGIDLAGDTTERRSLVAALRWMIDHGLATELHDRVDALASDEAADAVLRMRPDRVAMLPLPSLAAPAGGDPAAALLAAASSRGAAPRQWMRARLAEDPVLYRADCTDEEWTELRRRAGQEERYLEEMFGLVLEARAEGYAAVDPTGGLSDRPWPAGGTEAHAALLLVDAMREREGGAWSEEEVVALVEHLARSHARRWKADLVAAPDRLAHKALDLLIDNRLAARGSNPPGWHLLPAAARYLPAASARAEQGGLW